MNGVLLPLTHKPLPLLSKESWVILYSAGDTDMSKCSNVRHDPLDGTYTHLLTYLLIYLLTPCSTVLL